MSRLARPPLAIAEVRAAARRADVKKLELVRGQVMAALPSVTAGGAARPLGALLPYRLGEALAGAPEAVAARIDLEEARLGEPSGMAEVLLAGRPELEQLERARDFYIADESGHALVRLGGADGRLHDRVALHLAGPPERHPLPDEREPVRPRRIAFVRALRVGEPVWLLGHARTERDAGGLGATAYREPPEVTVFAGEAGPLHLYNERAFRNVAAWHALPWYRKLSVIVRNR